MQLNPESLALLRGLPQSVVEHFNKMAIKRHVAAREAISWQSDPSGSVYFITRGEVEIYRLSPAGREQILDRLGAGACFNLVPALLNSGENQANARALGACDLLCVTAGDFRSLMREHSEFAVAVAGFLAERLARMTGLIETLSLYSVRQRLARFLMDQADGLDGSHSARWTQTDMAKRLGTVRDVLGRTLRRMADEGLIRFERENIVLVDRQGIERAAGEPD